MSDNLLFSRKKSDELDRLAQEIDPRLVLFCEYTPVERYLSNESGFILGCLNLYKCTVDGMILWSALRDDSSYLSTLLPPQMSQKLADIHKQQGYLRAMFAHNNSEDACETQYLRICDYKRWLSQTVGVDTMETEAHFGSALAGIEQIGDTLYSILCELINRIKALAKPEQEIAIDEWIDFAAEWFSQKKYHEIYKGWFISHIRIRADSTSIDTPTAVHNLMRNALKRDADEAAWRQIGVSHTIEIPRLFKQILNGSGTMEERRQEVLMLKEKILSIDEERKQIYDDIEKYDQKLLEIKWQELLHDQLITIAKDPENLTKISFLCPNIWLDTHIQTYIYHRPLQNKPYESMLKPSK